MKIGTREVGPGAPVFIIAECGSNHGGSLDAALALIDAAAEAGADAAKFQRFRVDSFLVPRANPEALRPYELPDAWLPKLRDRCAKRGIEFLCTAFDIEGVRVVDPFVNAHKIGSAEANMPALILAVNETHKPVIASLGMAEWCPMCDVTLFCVSKYPAEIKGYLTGKPPIGWVPAWGVSDHTLDPLTVPCAAVALGACVVEKHFRLFDTTQVDRDHDRSAKFVNYETTEYPDYAVSIDPDEFLDMVRAIRATESAVRG